jgi:hypothetical protein
MNPWPFGFHWVFDVSIGKRSSSSGAEILANQFSEGQRRPCDPRSVEVPSSRTSRIIARQAQHLEFSLSPNRQTEHFVHPKSVASHQQSASLVPNES